MKALIILIVGISLASLFFAISQIADTGLRIVLMLSLSMIVSQLLVHPLDIGK